MDCALAARRAIHAHRRGDGVVVTASLWLLERAAALAAIAWPSITAEYYGAAVRVLGVVLVVGGVGYWLFDRYATRRRRPSPKEV
jgi:hypothetical protein